MNGRPLVNKKAVSRNRALRANQRRAKKSDPSKRLFNKDTKIYQMVQLVSEEPLDLCGPEMPEDFSHEKLPDDTDALLANMRSADVRGMKDGVSIMRKIETVSSAAAAEKMLIVNGIEDDPGLVHDKWLIQNRWETILFGIRVLQRCLDFSQTILATRTAPPAATSPGITCRQEAVFYPFAEEHLLIKRLLDIALDRQENPAKHGILVLNVQTVMMIGRAAVTGQISPYKYITAANLVDGTARVVRLPIGMHAEKVLEAAFPTPKKSEGFIGDGAMSAAPLTNGAVIRKTTSAVLCARPIHFAKAHLCSGCGICWKNCPVDIPAGGMINLSRVGMDVPRDIVSACLRCNVCSYVCEQGIDVSLYLR